MNAKVVILSSKKLLEKARKIPKVATFVSLQASSHTNTRLEFFFSHKTSSLDKILSTKKGDPRLQAKLFTHPRVQTKLFARTEALIKLVAARSDLWHKYAPKVIKIRTLWQFRALKHTERTQIKLKGCPNHAPRRRTYRGRIWRWGRTSRRQAGPGSLRTRGMTPAPMSSIGKLPPRPSATRSWSREIRRDRIWEAAGANRWGETEQKSNEKDFILISTIDWRHVKSRRTAFRWQFYAIACLIVHQCMEWWSTGEWSHRPPLELGFAGSCNRVTWMNSEILLFDRSRPFLWFNWTVSIEYQEHWIRPDEGFMMLTESGWTCSRSTSNWHPMNRSRQFWFFIEKWVKFNYIRINKLCQRSN